MLVGINADLGVRWKAAVETGTSTSIGWCSNVDGSVADSVSVSLTASGIIGESAILDLEVS